MDVLSAQDFHVNIYFRYLAFDHSFRCWLKELLLRGGFSEVGGVVTSRQILLGGVVISRQILRGWRIIEALTCWLENYRGSYLLVGGLSRFLLVGWRIIFATACLACSAGSSACCRSPI